MTEKQKKMYINQLVHLFDEGRQAVSGMDLLAWLEKIGDTVEAIYAAGRTASE
ncbi:hypothetical protein FACS1894180_9360 [Bacteroidia bacterium]|nr:hypothetical protein FACS1894180_9360 [Bacteroidia bacterium]